MCRLSRAKADAKKQSILLFAAAMDCFAPLAMTVSKFHVFLAV